MSIFSLDIAYLLGYNIAILGERAFIKSRRPQRGRDSMAMDYSRLQDILKTNGTTIYKLNAEKVIGSATRQKLLGQVSGGIDSRPIEALCKRLNCQPGDFMTYVPDDP